jgi:riboflavin synthase
MFTGIIQELGTVQKISSLGDGLEISIACSFASGVHVDESIAVNGVCHTVTAFDEDNFTIQSVAETLRKTNIGELKEGTLVNLERSLTLQKGIEGHLVQGHVDTTAEIVGIEQEGSDWLFKFRYPEEKQNLIVGRGSITVDGISLTVARDEGDTFTVAIIPYTYENTNLKFKKKGDRVNLEFDVIGKYVMKYMASLNPGGDFSGLA